MTIVIPSWRPKKRQVTYSEKPLEIPDAIYQEAKVAKKSYNEEWEVWVYKVACQHNCPVAIAEDACIRGIQKEILQIKLVYGDKIGTWFENYLDMGEIFRMVNHPIYLPQLG